MSQDHQLQQQRFELKYLVPEGLTPGLRDFLGCHLELDDFGVGRPNLSYPVHSVYLDTDDLRTHQATLNGDKNRFKLRLRYYNDEPDSPVFCEVKGRVDSCILKRRCPVRRDAVPLVLAGQWPDADQMFSADPKYQGALQRFIELMLQINARPKAHNCYSREAWVSPENNSVRVTFDRQVHIEPFFEPHAVVPMTNPTRLYADVVIFEIKFTNRFPNWLREMVQGFGLRQFAAAKYSGGVTFLGEHKFCQGAQRPAWVTAPAPAPRRADLLAAVNRAATPNHDFMTDWLLNGDYGTVPTNYATLVIGVLLAFVCGHVIAWTYMITHTGLSYSRSYVTTLLLLPVIVTLVMMILANNLVLAFGLMAIFAMVRFRSTLRDTLDTVYVLAVIVVGLACGTLKFSSAIIGCLAMVTIMFYVRFTGFGTRHRYDLILNVQWVRPALELPELIRLLQRHSRAIQCASQRSNESLSGLDISYRLLLRDPARSHEMVEEIRAFQGVARVTSLQAEDESEL